MTKKEFQVIHSEIIEYFQWIEFNLKKICALLNCEIQGNKDFDNYLETYGKIENDTIGFCINELKKLQKKKNLLYLNEDDYELLDKIRKKRNYWCHACFVSIEDNIVFSRDGCVKDKSKIQRILDDLKFAEDSDNYIKEIFESLLKKYRINPPNLL